MLGKMKDLMEMKKHADRIKKELDAETIEVTDVRGIKVVVNGSQYFKSIEIDDNLLSPERKSRFQSDLIRSCNAAIKKSQTVAARKMSSVMPGL